MRYLGRVSKVWIVREEGRIFSGLDNVQICVTEIFTIETWEKSTCSDGREVFDNSSKRATVWTTSVDVGT